MLYSINPENKTRPPYSEIEAIPAPSAVVGGKNADPIEAIKTTPKPMANGPPIYRNLSLGAVTATVVNPPTTPAVYQAALLITNKLLLKQILLRTHLRITEYLLLKVAFYTKC